MAELFTALPGERQRGRILLVEDDRALRTLLVEELEELDLEVKAVEDAERAAAAIHDWQPDLVVSDLRLPGRSGVDLLEDVQTLDESVRPAFVIITAFGSIRQAVAALKQGADDFLTKPLDFDHLRVRIRRLLRVQRMKWESRQFRQMKELTQFHGIVLQSPAMRNVASSICSVAPARGAVLIQGETGVGKELVARAIHEESPRSAGPFIPINCAGVPESLVESEFFGHEQGAFTGARRQRPGLFAAAKGGTIFLDEVGELSPGLQAKLLRVLQDGQVRPVGSDTESEVDVRVIAATNRDIEEDVFTGRFREDLFYRLAIYVVKVPPLRRRREDIEALASYFLEQYSNEAGKTITGMAPEVITRLRRWSFPGNVRELQNIIESAVTFCSGSLITVKDLPRRVRQPSQATAPSRGPGVAAASQGVPRAMESEGELLSLEEAKQRYIRHVLALTSGNKRRAAALLCISRRTLYRYIDKDVAADGSSGGDAGD